MDPELETLEATFNNKIESWISKQGIIFQFTHDTGSGALLPKICGLCFRLLLIIILGLIMFWFYLSSRPSSESFKLDVAQQITKGIYASDVEVANITRVKGGLLSGDLLFSSITLGETDSSFFEDWYIQEEDVSLVGRKSVIEREKSAVIQDVTLFPMGLMDTYKSRWSAKEVSILKMDIKLKAGDDTDEGALECYSTIFQKYDHLNINHIQVYDASILWGYSEHSSGSIKGAELSITKGENLWEIDVKGGMFSHGWLKDGWINEMKIICKSSGEVIIESATLSFGEGQMKFKANILVKAKPEVTGEYNFENISITDLIGEGYDERLDGVVDGEGKLAGELNTAEGLKSTTTITLKGKPKVGDKEADDDSVLVIRGDEFQFLKFMQMKNPRNSYSLLRAYRGELIVEHQGLNTYVTVNNVRCGRDDLILLKGKFGYAVNSLNSDDSNSDGERMFSGSLKLGLTPKVFESDLGILETYPVDGATLRVWFDVKLQGQMDDLTEEMANELMNLHKNTENK